MTSPPGRGPTFAFTRAGGGVAMWGKEKNRFCITFTSPRLLISHGRLFFLFKDFLLSDVWATGAKGECNIDAECYVSSDQN